MVGIDNSSMRCWLTWILWCTTLKVSWNLWIPESLTVTSFQLTSTKQDKGDGPLSKISAGAHVELFTYVVYCQIKGVLSSVLQSGFSGLKVASLGDEAGAKLLDDADDSAENQLQAALEQTLLKNIQYKVSQKIGLTVKLWLHLFIYCGQLFLVLPRLQGNTPSVCVNWHNTCRTSQWYEYLWVIWIFIYVRWHYARSHNALSN